VESTAETRERLTVFFLRNAKVVWDLLRPGRHFRRRGDRVATRRQSNGLRLALRSHDYLILLVRKMDSNPRPLITNPETALNNGSPRITAYQKIH
jgi:hypothetical protein